jgi:hypothetical protein
MDKKDDDTSEYSSTKAPETAEYAEERDPTVDSRLIPGGAHPRSDTQQGMAGLDRDDVPGGAVEGGPVIETGRKQGNRPE